MRHKTILLVHALAFVTSELNYNSELQVTLSWCSIEFYY